MKSYLNKIMNNCSEVSFLHLQKNEVSIPFKKRMEMNIHVKFCKCCQNFIKQSDIIDQQLKLYKDLVLEQKNTKASDELKDKLEKIISEKL
jgi:hypothetical protein